MMKRILIILSIITSIGLSGCEENMPIIPELGPQVLGERKVLIEEITGVRCVNCPKGSAEIENLLALYPENLIAVSIHAGFFSPPYDESNYDFRTQEGSRLLTDFFGEEPFGYPSATINRKKFPGEFSLYLGDGLWNNYISSEASADPTLSVTLEKEYDPTTRELKIDVSVVPFEDLPEDVHLTVMITESEIQDYQLTPNGLEPDYIHKHVLRKIVTSYNGDAYSQPLSEGISVKKTYTTVLDAGWNAANCNIIASVHRSLNTNKEVLQAAEVHVGE